MESEPASLETQSIEPPPLGSPQIEPTPSEPEPTEAGSGELPRAHVSEQPETSAPIDAGLQPWTNAPEVVDPAISVPPDGRGSLAFGALLLIGGTISTSLGTAALLVDDPQPGIGITGVVLGVPSMVVGSVLTWRGARRQGVYRAWQASTPIEAPPQGTGLLASGAALIIGGTSVVTISGVGMFCWNFRCPQWPWVGFGLGGSSIVIGSTLLIAGAARNGKFKRWKAGDPYVLPTFAASRQGLQLGLVGRF